MDLKQNKAKHLKIYTLIVIFIFLKYIYVKMKVDLSIIFSQLVFISCLLRCCSCENKILNENKAEGLLPKGPFLLDAFEVPVNDARNLERFPLKANWIILKQAVSFTNYFLKRFGFFN